MASLTLKNIKKIYPFNGDDAKKKKKKKDEPEPVAMVVPVVSPDSEITDDYDDEELIAVISAAVAAYGEAEGKQYRVIGVRKKEKALRSGWSSAGIADNTRPF